MAKKRTQNVLAAAIANHAEDQTEYGQQLVDLPPGITNGKARLSNTKLGTYGNNTSMAGEKYIRLAGTILEPKRHTWSPQVFEEGEVVTLQHQEMELEGLQTSIMLPLCDAQGRDTDENVGRALNEIRKLGGEDCTKTIRNEQDLEELLSAILEEAPVFKFGTSASTPNEQYPTPRTWENWYGTRGVNGQVEIEDEVGEEDEPDEEEETEEEVNEEKASEDLDVLAEAADADDVEAQGKLEAMADEAGLDSEEYETWSDLVVALKEGTDDSEDDTEEEEYEDVEEAVVPEKGDVYYYKPKGKRTKVECEVTAVLKTKETCSLKDPDGKLHKGVAWSDLSEEA